MRLTAWLALSTLLAGCSFIDSWDHFRFSAVDGGRDVDGGQVDGGQACSPCTFGQQDACSADQICYEASPGCNACEMARDGDGCTVPDDCGPGYTCFSGSCIFKCRNDGDCASTPAGPRHCIGTVDSSGPINICFGELCDPIDQAPCMPGMSQCYVFGSSVMGAIASACVTNTSTLGEDADCTMTGLCAPGLVCLDINQDTRGICGQWCLMATGCPDGRACVNIDDGQPLMSMRGQLGICQPHCTMDNDCAPGHACGGGLCS